MKPKDPIKIETIFDTTIDIIYEQGLSGLNMSKISERSGLGMGTIYNYFETKEKLIKALFHALEDKLSLDVYEDINPEDPFMINLKRVFNSYFMNRWNFEKEYVFREQYRNSKYYTESDIIADEKMFAKAIELLEQGKKELLVKYVDTKFLLTFITGGIKEIVTEMKRYNLPLDQQAMNTTYELCVQVVLK